MPMIKYVEFDGTTIKVDVPEGTTLMQAAVDHQISGIWASCGGGCSCGTCHCFIEEARYAELPEPEPVELLLLDAITETKPNSRLSCQITMTEALSGLVIYLPRDQLF